MPGPRYPPRPKINRLWPRIFGGFGSGSDVFDDFETEAGPLNLRLSRKGMHLWYRGLALVLPQTHWNLPEPLPEWLQEPMTPAAVRDLLDRPLPPDLDKPASGR